MRLSTKIAYRSDFLWTVPDLTCFHFLLDFDLQIIGKQEKNDAF